MKFLLLTLIAHTPDPLTGVKKSPAERLHDVIDKAVLAEELGFDSVWAGERPSQGATAWYHKPH